MADIRIKDLPTTATQTASDDFIALDGTVNGTRKIDASAPSFKTSVTSPSIVAPAATALTLTGGSTGASLVLGQGANGGAAFAPKGTGQATVTNPTAAGTSEWQAYSATKRASFGIANGSYGGYNGIAANDGFVYAENGLAYTADNGTHRWNISTAEAMRVTTTRNLLIGTQTDMTGSGGLKIAGTTAATNTTSGALIVAGGVGVSGAGYFGAGANLSGSMNSFGGPLTINFTGNPIYSQKTTAIGVGETYGYGIGDAASSGRSTFFGHGKDASGNYFGNIETYGASVPIFLRSSSVGITATTSASSSTVGALTIGNGSAATNVAIGGGNVNAGGTLTVGTAGQNALIVQSNNGKPGLLLKGTSGNGDERSYSIVANNAAFGDFAIMRGATQGADPISGTAVLSFAAFTGAATFAGAVTIAGTVIHTLSATPASASATGTVGTMSWDANYIYICTSSNVWKRVAISTW